MHWLDIQISDKVTLVTLTITTPEGRTPETHQGNNRNNRRTQENDSNTTANNGHPFKTFVL